MSNKNKYSKIKVNFDDNKQHIPKPSIDKLPKLKITPEEKHPTTSPVPFTFQSKKHLHFSLNQTPDVKNFKDELKNLDVKGFTRKKTVFNYSNITIKPINYEIQSYNQRYKVAECTYITKVINPIVYICNCSLEKLFIVCEKCKISCHENHVLFAIDNQNFNFTCNCGEERHPSQEYNPIELEKNCLLSSIFNLTSPRLSVFKNELIICGFCYIMDLVSSTNDYSFHEDKDSHIKKYYILEDEPSDYKCQCEKSVSLPIQGLMTYSKLTFELKKDNLFMRHFLLENNINLLTKSNEIFSVYKDVFKDFKNFAEVIAIDPYNLEVFLVEDKDLLRSYISIFSILAVEKGFQYVSIIDIFSFLSFEQRFNIIKNKLDSFSFKELDNKIDEEYKLIRKANPSKMSQTALETINEYFFSVYQFYIYIRNYFLKYNNNFTIDCILNMTFYQRYYYIKQCLEFGNGYIMNKDKQLQYQEDTYTVKKALEYLPDAILDWYEKILNSNMYIILREDSNIYMHFLEVFLLLCKFNLLTDTIRIRFYSLLIDILYINIERSKNPKNKKSFYLILLQMDKIFEIIFYGLCYHNDKVIMERLHLNKNKSKIKYVFDNTEEEEEKALLSKIFGLSLENVDLQVAQFEFITDIRFEIDMAKINFISKKILDMFLGNSLTEESESYILSITNLEKFDFKVGFNYSDYISSSISNEDKDIDFLTITEQLSELNTDYMQYNIKFPKYLMVLEEIINNDIQGLIRSYKISTSNSNAYLNYKKQHSKLKNNTVLQSTFRCCNFMSQFNTMLYILNKALHFYQETILSKEQLKILIELIILCVKGDFENLTIFTSVDSKYFFDLFKDHGVSVFLQEISQSFYDKQYSYDNYIFISSLITYYIYYIDPSDFLSFDEYYNNLIKYEIITKKTNYKQNLNHKTYDDFYLLDLKRLTSQDKIMIERTLVTNEFKNAPWIAKLSMISTFFPVLINIIESKDFTFEENLKVFELMDHKVSKLSHEVNDKIFHAMTNSNEKTILKDKLEEFLIGYYSFFNVLLKKQLYQIDLVKDSLEFLPLEHMQSFEKLEFRYMSGVLNLSPKLANQLLIYISFYKSILFINILIPKEQRRINKLKSRNNLPTARSNNNYTINLIIKNFNSNRQIVRNENNGGEDKLNESPPSSRLNTNENIQISDRRKTYFDNDNAIIQPNSTAYQNFEVTNNTVTEKHEDFLHNNDFYDDLRLLHQKDKAEHILKLYLSQRRENDYDSIMKTEESKPNNIYLERRLDDKIIISTALRSYIDQHVEKLTATFRFNEEIGKMKDFIKSQLQSFDYFLTGSESKYKDLLNEISVFETFEFTILKPLIYFTNILKEVKILVSISGDYSYEYFSLLTYFLKVTYMIYSIQFPSSAKFSSNFNIKDNLPQNDLVFIQDCLKALIEEKDDKVLFFHIDVLLEIFQDIIYLLYKPKSEIEGNTNQNSKTLTRTFNNELNQIYHDYLTEFEEIKANNMTLIKLFSKSDDLLNFGSELISYLIKHQTFEIDNMEELESLMVPTKFFKKKEIIKMIKKKKKIEIKISKLRMFNYFSYMTTLCLRSSELFQEQLILLGNDSLRHCIYIVQTMVEKLFLIVYENSKKSHKNIQENKNNLFLVRQLNIAMLYILSSSENFNQTIQTMYINVTDLYNKLSCNLIKIIYIVDESEIHDIHLKQLSEIFTDVLLNLFMNTTDDNIMNLCFLSNVNKENNIERFKEAQRPLYDNKVLLKSIGSMKKREKDRKKKQIKEEGYFMFPSIIEENHNDDNCSSDTMTDDRGSDDDDEIKIEKQKNNYEKIIIDEKDSDQVINELFLKRDNVLVSLFCKVRYILDLQNPDKICNLVLLKTYSNIIKLAITLITAKKEITKEIKTIFHPSKMIDFLTICIRVLYLKYVLGYKMTNEGNFEEYYRDLEHLYKFSFNNKELKELKSKYYEDEGVYTDPLFVLSSDIYIMLNWYKINGDQETKTIFKNFEDVVIEDSKIDFIRELENTQFKKQEIDEKSILKSSYYQWKLKVEHIKKIGQTKFKFNKEEYVHMNTFYKDLLKNIDIMTEISKEDVKVEEWSKLVEIKPIENRKPLAYFDKNIENMKNTNIHIKTDKLNTNTGSFIERLINSREEASLDSDSEDDDKDDEVMSKERIIKKVYFIENPLVRLIKPTVLHNFFNNTDRDDWLTKVSSILKLYKEIFYEVKYNMNLKERSVWQYYTLNLNYEKIEWYSFLLVLIINIMLLFSLGDANLYNINNPKNERVEFNIYYITIAIGGFVVLVNFITFLVYLSSRYRYLINLSYYKSYGEIKDYSDISYIEKSKIYLIENLMFNPTLLLLFTNILFGLIGISNPFSMFTFTILLLHFSKFSETAMLIISAFKTGLVQLLYMIVLLAIIIWFISVTSFDFFAGAFDIPIKDGKENICSTALNCFISFFNYGVRNGGGIGDILPYYKFSDTGFYIGIYFAEMVFYVTIDLLLLNMINGIIINTFTALREDMERKKNDIENNCFICNLDKTTLHKAQIDSNHHIRYQHDIKSYLVYLINIKLKKEKDLDPDETHILNCVKNNDVSFFPCERALDWDWREIKKDDKLPNES